MSGAVATGVVRRGMNQTIRVSMPVRSADGRYEAVAEAILMIPAGEDIPTFSRHGHITTVPVAVEVAAEVNEPPTKLVLNSHTVCRGPDGTIKWEADTIPVEIPTGAFDFCGNGIPPFQLDTTRIKTGREHF